MVGRLQYELLYSNGGGKSWKTEREIQNLEELIEAVISEENAEVKAFTNCVENCKVLNRFMRL